MELSEGLAVAAVVADTSRGAAAALEDAHRDPLRWAWARGTRSAQ